MNILFGDLETFCTVPIKHGVYRYAEDVEITLGGYAMNDEPVAVDDYTAGADPQRFIDACKKADKIVFHNLPFDRTMVRHAWGYDIPLEKCVDTMVLALAHSLPGGLAKLCKVLNVPLDQAKDSDGKRLIQLFCKPRPKRQKIRRYTRETHPDEWASFIEYARLDIEAMRAVYKRLPKWNWTQSERELWLLDQKINDRGVAIDMDLVGAAIKAVAIEQSRLADEVSDSTLVVGAATQRDALMTYIAGVYDVALTDLRGATVEKLLEDESLPQELRWLLNARLLASTTSTAKYTALQNATSSDGRLRGTLQFCGASRTGRWAGRLFQPQNLPRPNLKGDVIEGGIQLLKAGAADLATDNIMELTSNAIRGCIVAPPGKKLVVADLSNIEGRVLAWLAGEGWKLQAFRDFDAGAGPDLYVATAARTFKLDPAKVTKQQRQWGKVLELALGYEGGVGAFITFAAVYGIDLDDMAAKARPSLGAGLIAEAEDLYAWNVEQGRSTFGLSKDTWVTIDAIKRAWRYAHPKISSFWKVLQQAVIDAGENPGACFEARSVSVRRDGAWLKIILPSGRALSYPAVRVEGGKITYTGTNQYTRQWGRIGTYGGKLVENCTQSCARDILAEGMIAAEHGGYEIVLSVHDELITEVNESEGDAQCLSYLMTRLPAWADGLPLAAAGFETYRYKKED